MIAQLIAWFLTVLVIGLCAGAMAMRIKPVKDADIDTILAEAEKPYYEKSR